MVPNVQSWFFLITVAIIAATLKPILMQRYNIWDEFLDSYAQDRM